MCTFCPAGRSWRWSDTVARLWEGPGLELGVLEEGSFVKVARRSAGSKFHLLSDLWMKMTAADVYGSCCKSCERWACCTVVGAQLCTEVTGEWSE
eukprot:2534389-Amphidinium_carterae.1